MTTPESRSMPPFAFGGDYNPEQWPVEVHAEDMSLMREAGVDLVTLGVFSWAMLEPAEGEYEFGWLDQIMDRLHTAGIRVDLATATASPPPWLAHRYPESLPVTVEGNRMWPGARQGFCPSSPVYRDRSLALCRMMAQRYGDHPAVVLWHVGNELGNHNALCYCDVSAAAFRVWLEKRYGDVDGLNQAWGTAFWSQRYASFEEVLPPRLAPAFPNPTQQLDFRRFSSDQLLDNYIAERDILHELSPDVPVTTNFMVMEHVREMDYWAWAREVDVVSNDHYLMAENREAWRELAFSADLTRGLAGGRPWLLMEHSTSAVNWQPRNVPKRPGELLRTSLAHVARGADAALFFQWRASKAGAEKFHSGLVPHAGTNTRLWREVVELSRTLDRIEEAAGSGASNQVALLFDWQAWWATELDSHPSVDVTYLDRAHAVYDQLLDLGVGVDFKHPEDDLTGYDLVVVPTLYTVTDAGVSRLEEAVAAGATALVTYFSGIVDENDHIRLGGYPGAFRDLLGVQAEEFVPLRKGENVRLDTVWTGPGWAGAAAGEESTADVWTEHLHLAGAEAVASYANGPLAGIPAVTRHSYGQGVAWYAACRTDPPTTAWLVRRLVEEAGVAPVASTRPGVEVVRRVAGRDRAAPDRFHAARSWVFVINHTEEAVSVAISGHDLVSDVQVDGTLRVAAGGVGVVREA